MIANELSQRTQKTLKAVRNLPITFDIEREICDVYVIEMRNVRTEKQLKAFTKRWESVWKIPWSKNWSQSDTEEQIVSGRYNAKNTLKCINKNRINGSGGCYHIRRNKRCLSADILVPSFLMRLQEIRTHFNVMDTVVLIQLVRAIHEDVREIDLISYFDGTAE